MGIEEKIEFLKNQVQQQQERIEILEQSFPKNEKKFAVKEVATMLDLTVQGVLYHKRTGNINPIPGKQRNIYFTETEIQNFINKQSKHQ